MNFYQLTCNELENAGKILNESSMKLNYLRPTSFNPIYDNSFNTSTSNNQTLFRPYYNEQTSNEQTSRPSYNGHTSNSEQTSRPSYNEHTSYNQLINKPIYTQPVQNQQITFSHNLQTYGTTQLKVSPVQQPNIFIHRQSFNSQPFSDLTFCSRSFNNHTNENQEHDNYTIHSQPSDSQLFDNHTIENQSLQPHINQPQINHPQPHIHSQPYDSHTIENQSLQPHINYPQQLTEEDLDTLHEILSTDQPTNNIYNTEDTHRINQISSMLTTSIQKLCIDRITKTLLKYHSFFKIISIKKIGDKFSTVYSVTLLCTKNMEYVNRNVDLMDYRSVKGFEDVLGEVFSLDRF
ncbi:hypothetical protein NAPIS_ORF00348 [Vairimorpha apis BRL 01]|uniref:Uncharacterized protein n=1 Tax=Vairimorpha apis BRL 01 TaxID=1037528 RepID=T0LCP2_9MICR|nr:hypothetical protein NAPIS_ORF00348 [Vairimorpha apis BRL 01]